MSISVFSFLKEVGRQPGFFCFSRGEYITGFVPSGDHPTLYTIHSRCYVSGMFSHPLDSLVTWLILTVAFQAARRMSLEWWKSYGTFLTKRVSVLVGILIYVIGGAMLAHFEFTSVAGSDFILIAVGAVSVLGWAWALFESLETWQAKTGEAEPSTTPRSTAP